MSPKIDVYREWLGITEAVRPLSYYQLLRLKTFEDDPIRISSHYRKMNAHVRKYSAGDFAKESQELLNELARAMLCLTDARRKAEYDASLGREDAQPGRRRTLEELLLARKVIDQAQLEKARKFASAVGVDIHDAVVQQKLAKPEVVMQVYAESQGLPYVELADVGCDLELVPRIPATLARQHSCVPVMVDDGQLLMASPNPLKHEIEDQLRLRLEMPVRTVLCTAAGVNEAITKHYPKEAAAAEMAAASHSPPKPTTKQGEAGTAAPELDWAAAKEAKKKRLMVVFMTFNFTFMAVMFYQLLLRPMVFAVPPTTFGAAAIPAFGIGLAAAAVMFAVQTFKK